MKWAEIINRELKKDYMKHVYSQIEIRKREGHTVYPEQKDIFRAFELTPLNNTKVVILGQDPYHDGNADGLAFSCKRKMSPSLKAIYDALQSEPIKENTPLTLESWAKQGVLLINSIMTVERGWAKSHSKIGWQNFTATIIRALINDPYPKVFLLWGSVARDTYTDVLTALGDEQEDFPHISIVYCEHPAKPGYERRRWRNNDCFDRANDLLLKAGVKPIEWRFSPVVDAPMSNVGKAVEA